MRIGKKDFDFDHRSYVMGILNVTPDSFSDGGSHMDPERALTHAIKMMEEGASIIDVGGESTRPGYEEVAVREEIERVVPVIRALKKNTDAVVSLDTCKHEVARAGIEAGAEVNVIEKISLNGAVQTVKDKAVALTVDIPAIPSNVSAFSNDADYVSKTEMNTAINIAVANSGHLKRLKVDTLPTSDIDPNTIYMIPGEKPDGDNRFDEYMYINDVWEKVGGSDVDLSGYAKSADFTEITNTQIDSIIATAFTDSTT